MTFHFKKHTANSFLLFIPLFFLQRSMDKLLIQKYLSTCVNIFNLLRTERKKEILIFFIKNEREFTTKKFFILVKKYELEVKK